MSAVPAFAMSFLCIVGGSVAFFSKGSVPSFVAGSLVGILYLYSASQIAENDTRGLNGAFYASALLTLSSLPRITKGPIPKILAISSAVVGFY
ncbi:hypothetical protein C8R46DRAFT_1095234 [Mycena filopes]|nr:hypothetical protein C8R46DRAFT_1095234 [Mycena filopes]